MATGAIDGIVHLLDLTTGKLIRALKGRMNKQLTRLMCRLGDQTG